MRSEVRTAVAILATSVVLLGSATMALAADDDGTTPGPGDSTATTLAPTSSTPTDSGPTDEPTDEVPTPEPSETTPSPTTSTPTPDVPTGAFTVDDAQVRWGINDESNNRAFAPGTFNFMSAGKIRNPGKGGVIMPQADWKAKDGDVTIEKFLDGAWRPATWADRQTTSAGTTMSGTNGPFSNHEVVLTGGAGTVDPAKKAATIQWKGSFTVIYYSGYSFFYVSDPKLTVTKGIGTLTGTLGGYGSSMDDLTKWAAVEPATVTLANLGTVDLSKDLGFTASPAYRSVAVSLPGGQVPQVRTGDSWGSFPQSFITWQATSGTGAYWYSSGGSADAHKVAKPVTISYAAGAPVTVEPPRAETESGTDKVTNDAPDAPTNGTVAPPGLTAPSAALAPPGAADVSRAGSTTTQLRPASTVTGIVSSPRTDSGPMGVWILGGVLLAGALLVAVSPLAYSATRKTV